jgi:hypothetical protein
MSPRKEWHLAQSIPSQSARKVLSVRLESNAEMQGDPSDKTESQHIVTYNFRISSIEDATNDKYVGENYSTRAPPSWHSSTGHGTLFLPPKTVRTETMATHHY